MKILITLSQLEVTGVEIYSISIANKLIELGHEVFIVSDTLFMAAKTSVIYFRTCFQQVDNIQSEKFDMAYKFYPEKQYRYRQCPFARQRLGLQYSMHDCADTFNCLCSRTSGDIFFQKTVHAYGEYTIAICERLNSSSWSV